MLQKLWGWVTVIFFVFHVIHDTARNSFPPPLLYE
jgi:hypothetical protein